MNLKTYVFGFINNFPIKKKNRIEIKNITDLKNYNLLNKKYKQLNQIKMLTFLSAASKDDRSLIPSASGEGSNIETATLASSVNNRGPLTEEQKTAIRKILERGNDFDLTDSSLETLDMETLIDEVFNKEEDLMKDVEFFKKGDVLEVSFLLKHSVIKINSSINNPFRDGIVQSPNANVAFLNRMNYLSKKITLNYIVYETVKGFDYFELTTQLCNAIWSNKFRNLTSASICLESVSLKTVYPRKRMTDSISIGVGDFGGISNSLNNISGRPFIFTLGTRFIQGDRDAFSVRWFFLDKNIKNPYEGRNDLQGTVPIQNICAFFREPVTFVKNNESSSNNKIVLRLAVATTRRNSPFAYAPVTKVWATGFVGNTQGSSILIPINSGIELPTQNGQILPLNGENPPLNLPPQVPQINPTNSGGPTPRASRRRTSFSFTPVIFNNNSFIKKGRVSFVKVGNKEYCLLTINIPKTRKGIVSLLANVNNIYNNLIKMQKTFNVQIVNCVLYQILNGDITNLKNVISNSLMEKLYPFLIETSKTKNINQLETEDFIQNINLLNDFLMNQSSLLNEDCLINLIFIFPAPRNWEINQEVNQGVYSLYNGLEKFLGLFKNGRNQKNSRNKEAIKENEVNNVVEKNFNEKLKDLITIRPSLQGFLTTLTGTFSVDEDLSMEESLLNGIKTEINTMVANQSIFKVLNEEIIGNYQTYDFSKNIILIEKILDFENYRFNKEGGV